jgi:hypothetical protein
MLVPLTVLSLALLGFQEPKERSEPGDPLRPSWKPVTLHVKAASSKVVLEDIFRQAEVRLTVDEEWEPKTVTLDLDAVPFWKAVDDLCRADGGLRFSGSPYEDEKKLVAQPWAELPLSYAGPLRFSVRDLSRVLEMNYPGRKDRTDVEIHLEWLPAFHSVLNEWPKPGVVELRTVRGADGRSLLPEMKVDRDFSRQPNGMSLRDRSAAWILHVQSAGSGSKSIPEISGVWRGIVLSDLEAVTFENPGDASGATRTVGPFRMVLDRCAAKEGRSASIEVIVKISPAEGAASPPAVPAHYRLLQSIEADGESKLPYFNVLKGDSGAPDGRIQFWLDKVPRELRLEFARTAAVVEIPFSFKDVRLPGAIR